jgi:hypothetical protein
MDDFEYLKECVSNWQDLPLSKLSRKQQAVVDVVSAIGVIEGDGVVCLWSECGDSMDRIIESFRMAGANEIADLLQGTSFCRDIITRTVPDANEWAYTSPEEEKKLREVLVFVSKKGPDAREGLLGFLPKRRS